MDVISLEFDHTSPSLSTELWLNITEIVTLDSSTMQLKIRVGYFGLYVTQDLEWSCKRNISSFSGFNQLNDPIGALYTTDHFKYQVLFPGML